VRELAASPGLLLVASRYEGLDQRVIDSRIDGEVSIGDYVLSGGEFAALVVIDAVVRLLPGALGDERSSVEESFSEGRLDWPHYTRPVEWEGRPVPGVLQGGNHAAIRRWRLAQSVARTWVRRPDLVVQGGLSSEESRLLNEFLARREVEDNG
jgi:tRNA (guanine37-N1)-methyltransferase